jgi:hypothetical protein
MSMQSRSCICMNVILVNERFMYSRNVSTFLKRIHLLKKNSCIDGLQYPHRIQTDLTLRSYLCTALYLKLNKINLLKHIVSLFYDMPVWLSRYRDSLQAGKSGNRIPVKARSPAPIQTSPRSHPASSLLPGGKRLGRGVEHIPPSSAEVKERVELYLYWPSRPPWPVLGRNLPFPSTDHAWHIFSNFISYPCTGLDRTRRLQEAETSMTCRQQPHEFGKGVIPTHRPSLSPPLGYILCTHSC